ncbi:hypothetical protein BCR34DRAFT_495478 [Clohesyomyces aquaticus]|uniref:Uncharacterized protein n=1 Tax=Clohesyomyces aquaticus TaxID=1231657 RepID=A0A1Y1YMP0_9PLEO|nr:hypothetical protein BCR34DRAFT_495478 [Clohesyomyces aquaticus]
MANNTIIHGWQDDPDFRGTFSIVKTCLGTVVLLCWSSVCPNVPSQKKGFCHKLSGKVQLFFLAILGPNFIFASALGQFNKAWRAKRALHRKGYTEWTLRHCFFANMGGIHLEFRDRKQDGLSTFPADTEQMLYLVKNRYMSLPIITKADIDDRNKADSFTRAIAIVQTIWFTVNIFGRISEGLFITTIELNTLSFVFLMICCSICWWHKPMDIQTPLTILVDVDLSTVLSANGTSTQSFGHTPLSFINRREWLVSQSWASYVRMLRRMLFLPRGATKDTDADHFPSIDFYEPELRWELTVGCWPVAIYGAILMAAWNFSFPTTTERLLWRISASINLAILALGSPLILCWEHRFAIAGWRDPLLGYLGFRNIVLAHNSIHSNGSRRALGSSLLNKTCRSISHSFDWMRNLSADDDPSLSVPLRVWLPSTAISALYFLSRLFILIEDAAGLRAVPQSTFQTVEWTRYWSIL